MYLSHDGDVDIFVDMPQEKLLPALKKRLSLAPYLSGKITLDWAEVHWKVRGCSTVHMVFYDWISDETVKLFGPPKHEDTCTCYMNSIPLSCHKQAVQRMYIQYGPSWRVPLKAKDLDAPHYARQSNIVKKLEQMKSKATGIVYESAVTALDPNVKYTEKEMELILAQLNVLKALIAYQKKTGDYKVT